jgi:hypothetical protein
MSLRTDYTGTLDTKLAEAITEGRKIVIDENNEPNPVAALSTALAAAANKGQKEFTYTASVGYQPEDLRQLGPLWMAFKTGVVQGLAEQQILETEFTVELNTSDQLATKVDITFTF